MILKDFKAYFIESLRPLFDNHEIESFFLILLEHFHEMKRIDLALQPDFSIDEEQQKEWERALNQLLNEKPIQYITGQTDFFGLPFYVNEHTLIPRPETEELVQWIIDEVMSANLENSKITILDIGTGTSCIAIALAKNLPNAKVFALDVSEKALEIAKSNADLNQVDITFLYQNILNTDDLGEQYDIIVSNPPYVRYLEKDEMKKNVLEYEPHLALFVEDNDALLFYRKIAQLAQKNLSQNGQLFFEINQYLGADMLALLKNLEYKTIELRKDLFGNDRMVRAG